MYFQGKLYEFPNDRQGFEKIRQILPKGCKIGIESTGVYHINWVKYLCGDYEIRVVNPLILKRLKGVGVSPTWARWDLNPGPPPCEGLYNCI